MSRRALGLMVRRLKAVGGKASFKGLYEFLWHQDRIGIDASQGAVKRGVRSGKLDVEKPKKNDSLTWVVSLSASE